MSDDAKRDWKVIHGGVHQGGFKPTGSVVSFTVAEAKAVDPDGNCLMLLTKWDAQQAGEKAKVATIAKVEAEQEEAESKKPAESHKVDPLRGHRK